MPGETLVESKELLADPEAVRVPEGEAGVVDDHAHVTDVVVDPLELEQDDSQPRGPRRHRAARERLERLAVREDVADARVARDALGERGRPVEGQALEELLRALVHEAETRLEVHDRLALDAEAEVPGLDDSGVDRPHGDLEDALALHAPERERLTRVDEVRAWHGVAAQRVIALRPVLMEREPSSIRMPLGDQAEQVVDLALETAGRERARRERGEAGRPGRDGDEHGHRRRELRRREDVGQREVAAGGARVGGGEELAARAERRQTIRERGNLPGGQPAADAARGRRGDVRGAGPCGGVAQRVEREGRRLHLRGPRSRRCGRGRRRGPAATRAR